MRDVNPQRAAVVFTGHDSNKRAEENVWAAQYIEEELNARGISFKVLEHVSQAPGRNRKLNYIIDASEADTARELAGKYNQLYIAHLTPYRDVEHENLDDGSRKIVGTLRSRNSAAACGDGPFLFDPKYNSYFVVEALNHNVA